MNEIDNTYFPPRLNRREGNELRDQKEISNIEEGINELSISEFDKVKIKRLLPDMEKFGISRIIIKEKKRV